MADGSYGSSSRANMACFVIILSTNVGLFRIDAAPVSCTRRAIRTRSSRHLPYWDGSFFLTKEYISTITVRCCSWVHCRPRVGGIQPLPNQPVTQASNENRPYSHDIWNEQGRLLVPVSKISTSSMDWIQWPRQGWLNGWILSSKRYGPSSTRYEHINESHFSVVQLYVKFCALRPTYVGRALVYWILCNQCIVWKVICMFLRK